MQTDPNIALAGRVNPVAACLVAVYLEDQGYELKNKSALVHAAFEALSTFIRQMDPALIKNVNDNHDAMTILTRMGLKWPGDRNSADWMKALRQDTFKDMTPEQIQKVNAYAEEIRAAEETPLGEVEEVSDDELFAHLQEIENDGNTDD